MYIFIVNPASRSGHASQIWTEIETLLKERNILYRVYFTSHRGPIPYHLSFSPFPLPPVINIAYISLLTEDMAQNLHNSLRKTSLPAQH